MGYERREGGPLDTWLSAIEGTPLPAKKQSGEEPIKCDFCSSVIERGGRVSHYGADRPLNPEASSIPPEERKAPLGLLRVYCNGCDRRELRFPCQGYHEIILRSDISPEGTLTSFEVLDFSPASDGVAWTPDAVWEALYGEPFSESPLYPVLTVGPEDIADDLASNSISVDELVDETGAISATDEELEELRERVEKSRHGP